MGRLLLGVLGLQPACVSTCVGSALTMVENFDAAASRENHPADFADPKHTTSSVRFVPR